MTWVALRKKTEGGRGARMRAAGHSPTRPASGPLRSPSGPPLRSPTQALGRISYPIAEYAKPLRVNDLARAVCQRAPRSAPGMSSGGTAQCARAALSRHRAGTRRHPLRGDSAAVALSRPLGKLSRNGGPPQCHPRPPSGTPSRTLQIAPGATSVSQTTDHPT